VKRYPNVVRVPVTLPPLRGRFTSSRGRELERRKWISARGRARDGVRGDKTDRRSAEAMIHLPREVEGFAGCLPLSLGPL